jgi:hypothetical protein
VEYILGRLPLMKNYSTPTIPSRMATRRAEAFPRGAADGTRGKGSRLFYVNHYAMTWSRCKESLFRSICCTHSVHILIICCVNMLTFCTCSSI